MDKIEKQIEDVKTLQSAHNEKLGIMTHNVERYREDLSEHIQTTSKIVNRIDKDINQLRHEHMEVVHEVRSAVDGLEKIANQVSSVYSEYKQDRDRQMKMIQINNTFRDRLLGAVGALTLLGTLLTVIINIDAIQKLF